MLDLVNSKGKFKIPVFATRTHGSEFLVYEADLSVNVQDPYKNRICILSVRPSSSLIQDLKLQLIYSGFDNHIIVRVIC
jgi:hypothetical protein